MGLKAKASEAEGKNKMLDIVIEKEKAKAESIKLQGLQALQKQDKTGSKWVFVVVGLIGVAALGIYMYNKDDI